MAAANISNLPRLFVSEQKLTEAEAQELITAAQVAKLPFLTHLCAAKLVNPLDAALWLSRKFNMPYFDLSVFEPAFLPDKFDLKLIAAGRILPLAKKGKILYIAVSDPTNEGVLNDIKFSMQAASVSLIVVEDNKLGDALHKIIELRDTSLSKAIGQDAGGGAQLGDLLMETEGGDDAGTPAPDSDDTTNDVDDAPVVKFLQQVLLSAINQGASDIHFEPFEKNYRIRFRQDGILFQFAEITPAISFKLASRIKVISKLDIAEKRVPQDGRLKLKLSATRAIDFRVSTLPTLFGEKIVMRILDPSSAKLGIDALGYDPDQKEYLLDSVSRPYGMVLVTGPTGSGKTVSLYTCLNILNEPGVNISTAEDPAEINLPGVNQVNINDKAGLSFPIALKAFLRQDPDIIMVGEIRDIETADIAMKAALTGHMVLSTLHTNDAPSTLTRLLDMGVAPFNIASAVILITAQRLGRRLCKVCKRQHTPPREALIEAGFKEPDLVGYGAEWNLFEPVGCDQCKEGYKGRVGIYQVMPVTDEMRGVILKHGTSLEVAAISEKNGVRNLRQAGLIKARQGITSLAEILAITNE